MTHHISGYIAKEENLKTLIEKNKLENAHIIRLNWGGFSFLPYSYALCDELHANGKKKLHKLADFPIVWVETDYFGGGGDQGAKFWENGVRIFKKMKSYGAIDDALKLLGIVAEEGNDEFDTLELGKYRTNGDWLRSIGKDYPNEW
jgi:hypothetical protein